MFVKALQSLLPRAAPIAQASRNPAPLLTYPFRRFPANFPQACRSFSAVVMDVPTFDLQVRFSSDCIGVDVPRAAAAPRRLRRWTALTCLTPLLTARPSFSCTGNAAAPLGGSLICPLSTRCLRVRAAPPDGRCYIRLGDTGSGWSQAFFK